MSRRLLSLILVLIVGACLLTLSGPVLAKDLFSGSCGRPGTDASAVCTDAQATDAKQDPLSGTNGLLFKITNIVAFIGGAVAVIMIIVSGLRYVTSGSDFSTSSRTDTDVESAKHTITNAVVGLVVIVLARTLILFVLEKLP